MTRKATPLVIKRGDGGFVPPPPSVPMTGLGRLRKIALVGSAETVEFAPWHDPTWEIWAHSVTSGRCKRMTRVFELHPEHVWRQHKKPQWPTYLQWLQRCPHPLYMLEKHADIPSSVRYPRERIFGECRAMIGRLHFGSQADFMIALALSEGVTHLGLFGVQYTAMADGVTRDEQLFAFKFWLGVAAGKGVQIVMPEGHPTFNIPAEVYGLESHSTPEKYAARLLAGQAVPAKQEDGTVRAERLRPAVDLTHALPPKSLVAGEMEPPDVARRRWEAMAF
jgi:hypothetical protein